MDANRSARRSAIPQLVVKIVGGKQVKHFTDPNSMKNAGFLRTTDGGSGRSSGPGVALPNPNKSQVAHRKAPERLCVTAPSGGRSQSHIHSRTATGSHAPPTQPTPQMRSLELQANRDVNVEDWLVAVASEELKGWKPHTLENIDEECASLDPCHTRTIHQSELRHLFLRRQVPLKLSTLASLLYSFSCPTHPEQVLYEKLLKFVQSLLQNQKYQNTEADIWKASFESGSSVSLDSTWSDGADTYMDPQETDIWLQRFQKMERALHMCDIHNTGYIEKEQARRLIQNYSMILDLGLSPFRVNEVVRMAQIEGKVHLATALQLLKDR